MKFALKCLTLIFLCLGCGDQVVKGPPLSSGLAPSSALSKSPIIEGPEVLRVEGNFDFYPNSAEPSLYYVSPDIMRFYRASAESLPAFRMIFWDELGNAFSSEAGANMRFKIQPSTSPSLLEAERIFKVAHPEANFAVTDLRQGKFKMRYASPDAENLKLFKTTVLPYEESLGDAENTQAFSFELSKEGRDFFMSVMADPNLMEPSLVIEACYELKGLGAIDKTKTSADLQERPAVQVEKCLSLKDWSAVFEHKDSLVSALD